MLTPRIAHRGTGPEHGFRSDEGNAEVTELRLACRNPGLNDEKRVSQYRSGETPVVSQSYLPHTVVDDMQLCAGQADYCAGPA
jgi:hypothetical protein